jgi:stage II sporulation protein AA (anti-sigma F factor antagonist)
MEPMLELLEDRRDDILILALKGRLDAMTAGGLQQKLMALIEGGQQRFLLDVAELTYISSAGLRVLLVAAKTLETSAGTLVFCSLKTPVQQVFDIAGFSSLFRLYPSRQEALQKVNRPET